MGISPNQYWASSANGKAMTMMLAKRGDVELVRDICEWLVSKHKNDLIQNSVAQGATLQQAKLRADNYCAGLNHLVEKMSDRNIETNASQIIDAIFARFYNAGQQQYARAMSWFADELRQRVKDDKI